jgi:hypothetical protein
MSGRIAEAAFDLDSIHSFRLRLPDGADIH